VFARLETPNRIARLVRAARRTQRNEIHRRVAENFVERGVALHRLGPLRAFGVRDGDELRVGVLREFRRAQLVAIPAVKGDAEFFGGCGVDARGSDEQRTQQRERYT
jgi:hypothetical protein